LSTQLSIASSNLSSVGEEDFGVNVAIAIAAAATFLQQSKHYTNFLSLFNTLLFIFSI
jgi:hypothetical protein